MSGSPAGALARAVLAELVAVGVRDVVVCPGSRSQALALAAAELERAGALRLRVRMDERVAGFLALGLAVETGRPVPVIVTSGTAVAELHPAILEASHSGVPVVVLSADRPVELLGTGANQTTVQAGIFGSAVRAQLDLAAPDADTDSAAEAARVAAVVLGASGPVHVNLAFREPLSDAGPSDAVPSDAGPSDAVPSDAGPADAGPSEAVPAGPGAPVTGSGRSAQRPAPLRLRPESGTVVVAGAGAGERAEELARALGAPLLAEAASGARFGPNLVAAYRELLDDPAFGGRVVRAVVIGHPTLSRQVPALLAREDVEVVVERGRGRDAYAPPGSAAEVVELVEVAGEHADATRRVAGPGGADDVELALELRAWVGRWVHASRALLDVEQASVASVDSSPAAMADWGRREVARLRAPVTRRELAEAVWSASWPHDRLVLGASRLIREVDRVVPGKRLRVHANRGLAGIDGTVSTAIGIALAAEATGGRAGTTRVLLGDLTLLHDAGALLFPDGEPRPRVQVIVGNDRGGSIFDGLEVAGSADAGAFDRVLFTPQSVDLAALAAAYGWEHRRVATRADLDQALTAPPGPTIVEVELAR